MKQEFVTITKAQRLAGDCTAIEVEADGPETPTVYVNLYLQGGDPEGEGAIPATWNMAFWRAEFNSMSAEGSYQAEATQGTETDIMDVLDCTEPMGMSIDPPEVSGSGASRTLKLKGTGPLNESLDVELLELRRVGTRRWKKLGSHSFGAVKCDGPSRYEGHEWKTPATGIRPNCTVVRIRVKWPHGAGARHLKWLMYDLP